MTSGMLITVSPVLLQIGMLIALMPGSVRLIRDSGRSLTAVFLAFFYVLMLLSGLYWVIYDLMRPETRMPFAANEIAEASMFLMLAAALDASPRHGLLFARRQAVGALAFAACNVALWIGWSGEWLQDIFVGAAFAFCLYCIACALTLRGALAGWEWIALGAGCAALAAGQGLTFVAAPPVKAALDAGCSLLLAAGAAFLCWRLIAAWRRKADPRAPLGLAAALYTWLTMAMYMSEGGWYNGFMIANALSLPLLWLCARKAVTEA